MPVTRLAKTSLDTCNYADVYQKFFFSKTQHRYRTVITRTSVTEPFLNTGAIEANLRESGNCPTY